MRFIDAFWDLVYAGMMGLLTACLMTGVIEHYRSGQTTMLLQVIVWPALALCAAAIAASSRVVGARDGRDANPAGRAMSGVAIAGLGFGAMLVLIALRMPVGLSMLVVGSIGYIHLSSWPAFFAYMKTNPYYQFANYTLSVIPLFILMGALAERAGISTGLFRARAGLRGASARRAGDGGDLGLHRVRRHLRLVGGDHGDVRPGGAARAAALQVRRRLRHRHDRRRRHARHPHSAVDHPGRLCHHHRAEHRQAVQGGADPGPHGRRCSTTLAIAWTVRRRPDWRRRPR